VVIGTCMIYATGIALARFTFSYPLHNAAFLFWPAAFFVFAYWAFFAVGGIRGIYLQTRKE
jgi:hypothetical protein